MFASAACKGRGQSMRLPRRTALMIAGASAAMAIALGWTWFTQKGQAAAASSAKVQVLVPIRNIPARVDLQPGMFKIALCDPRELPPNYIPAERDLTGHISVTDLTA